MKTPGELAAPRPIVGTRCLEIVGKRLVDVEGPERFFEEMAEEG